MSNFPGDPNPLNPNPPWGQGSGSGPLGPPRPRVPAPPPPPPRQSFLGIAFTLSVVVNLLLFGVVFLGAVFLVVLAAAAALAGGKGNTLLEEKLYAGDSRSHNKVAIVRVDGLILEGMTGYAERQIDKAAEDPDVKAVVLRIDSPGGGITASDDLHKRLTDLHNGNPTKGWTAKKPLVVSMGSLAASGGYYIAMPGNPIYAEPTTLTGSIGVYAAFPNASGLAEKYGVKLDLIKRGEVKGSGSMLRPMRPEEREVWDDMIGHAYKQFEEVVEKGRPKLQGKLEEFVVDEMRPEKDDLGHPKKDDKGKPIMFHYTRQRADGGVFTADKAKELELIDDIQYLDDAVTEAKRQAGLGSDYQAITYERPFSLSEALMGGQANARPATQMDFQHLANGLAPRVWYLAPGAEVSGILTAASR
jgi:protease IV